MKSIRFFIIVAVLVFAMQPAGALEFQLTGFAEALSTLNMEGEDPEVGFVMQSARVRFNTILAPWITANVQIGSVSGKPDMALRSAMITLSKETEDVTFRIGFGKTSVPIGVASGWYTAPANAFMYAPSLTENILGSWTDDGVFGSIFGKRWSLQAYAVDGSRTKVITYANEADKLANPDPEDQAGIGRGIAGGLRAALSPIEGLTLGASYALNGHFNGCNYSIMAGDVTLRFGPCVFIYQYLAVMPKFEFDDRRDSWFTQFELDLMKLIALPITPGVRYDYLAASAIDGADKAATIVTIQAMYKFENALRIGLAYRNGKNSYTQFNDLSLQVLTMF
jgi:hypothetical protein